jgi:hypothetical protein
MYFIYYILVGYINLFFVIVILILFLQYSGFINNYYFFVFNLYFF